MLKDINDFKRRSLPASLSGGGARTPIPMGPWLISSSWDPDSRVPACMVVSKSSSLLEAGKFLAASLSASKSSPKDSRIASPVFKWTWAFLAGNFPDSAQSRRLLAYFQSEGCYLSGDLRTAAWRQIWRKLLPLVCGFASWHEQPPWPIHELAEQPSPSRSVHQP